MPGNVQLTEGFQMKCVLKGILFSLIITIILGLAISLLLHFTSLSEGLLNGFSTFIFFISMLLGATIGAKTAGHKGLLHGLAISIIYWLLTLVMAFFLTEINFSLYLFLKRLAMTLAAGVLGGIIGIGLAK